MSKIRHVCNTVPRVHVRSALQCGPLPYERGWAWQHALLRRRLDYYRWLRQHDSDRSTDIHANRAPNKESSIEANSEANDNLANLAQRLKEKEGDDKDWILLLEHCPVYTLGRGAHEDHLAFLQDDPHGPDKRRRLGRTYRAADASRLNIDAAAWDAAAAQHHHLTLQQQVDALCQSGTAARTLGPVLAPNGIPIYRIERGGEVTYHGPGQLVFYPLLRLGGTQPTYPQDLHWYLRQIEEVVIQTLQHFGIHSYRDPVHTGVWVDHIQQQHQKQQPLSRQHKSHKIAAVGVSSSRWITTHGFALNVNTNLSHFDSTIITPCGIQDRGVTSMEQVLANKRKGKEGQMKETNLCPTVQEVAHVALTCFENVFHSNVVHDDPIW